MNWDKNDSWLCKFCFTPEKYTFDMTIFVRRTNFWIGMYNYIIIILSLRVCCARLGIYFIEEIKIMS